jgi:hypothetical protein
MSDHELTTETNDALVSAEIQIAEVLQRLEKACGVRAIDIRIADYEPDGSSYCVEIQCAIL